MKNITYLLGAGASFGALPLVKDLPQNLKKFSLELSGTGSEITKLKNDFLWLSKEAAKQASIDTLAKQFTLNGQKDNLVKLKNVLTFYFYYLQACKYPDKRYDLFFSTLLDDDLNMPPNIKVISWNYDLQFEIAFNNYTSLNNLQANQEKLCLINKGTSNSLNNHRFKIFKINGTAQFVKGPNVWPLDYYKDREKIKPHSLNQDCANKYREICKDGITKSSLSFAWETAKFDGQFKEVLNQTDILVVIGYSFPYFNRNLDTQLLEQMSPNLEKVYLQETIANFNIVSKKIKDIIGSFSSANIESTPTIDEFFIPHSWFDDRDGMNGRVEIW